MTTNPEELAGGYDKAQDTMNPEEVFEGDTLPVEYKLTPMQNTVEGAVEGFQGFPTAKTLIDIPPDDTWQCDEVFKYTAIDAPIGLRKDKPLVFPLTTASNARVTHISLMWTYARYSMSLKLDAKLPLGAAAKVKVVAIPGFVDEVSNEAALSFPGVIWDLAEKPSILVKTDWVVPEYLLPVGEAYATVAVAVIGIAMKEDETPEPLLITPSYIVEDVMFAVRTHVRTQTTPDPPPPEPTDANPTHGVGVVAEQVYTPTRVYNGYSKEFEVRDVWSWVYKIVGLVASTVGELIFPGSGEVVMLGVDLIWILFDLKSEGTRIDVGELMEVSVAKGTPVKVVRIGDFMGVEIGGPTMVKGFLTRGDPEDPELIPWVEPSVAAKMIPLNSMPRANTSVVPLAASIPAAVVMNCKSGGLGSASGNGYMKFVKGATSGEFFTGSRAILYGDDGDDYQWDLFDAPNGNRTYSSWNVARNIEAEGTYKGQVIGMTLGYFPRGWTRGQPPASIFSPFVNGEWAGNDVNVDVYGLIDSTGVRNARMYPAFAVSDTDYSGTPESTNGSPYPFVAPVRYSLKAQQFVPLYVTLSASGSGSSWSPTVTRNGVGMITVIGMAAALTTAEKDAGLNFAGLMALKPTGDSASRFIDMEEWTAESKPLEPPVITEAPDRVSGQKTTFNTWPPGALRGRNITTKTKTLNCTCAEWGTRCPHIRVIEDDVESEFEYGADYTRFDSSIDGIDCVTEQGPGDVGVKVQASVTGGIASNVNMNAPTQPLGSARTSVTADMMWSPVDINFQIPKDKMYVLPINVRNAGPVGALQPTHFQVEPLRHAYTGPKPGVKSWGKYRVSTVTNAYVNGRLLIIHIPGHITPDEISKMTPEQLMQYPRVEHELKGGDTEFSPKWTLPLPYMINASNQHNGHLVFRWAEYSLAGTSTEPSISIWINPEGCQHAIIIPHATYVPRMTRMITSCGASGAEQARFVTKPPRMNFSNTRDLREVLNEISHALRNPSENRANLGPFQVNGIPDYTPTPGGSQIQ